MSTEGLLIRQVRGSYGVPPSLSRRGENRPAAGRADKLKTNSSLFSRVCLYINNTVNPTKSHRCIVLLRLKQSFLYNTNFMKKICSHLPLLGGSTLINHSFSIKIGRKINASSTTTIQWFQGFPCPNGQKRWKSWKEYRFSKVAVYVENLIGTFRRMNHEMGGQALFEVVYLHTAEMSAYHTVQYLNRIPRIR